MAESAIDRARQLLHDSVLPGDVVAGIIGASKLEAIPLNELLLSEIFFEFSKLKPHLFEDFDFFEGSTFPFTDVLQDQLAYFETEHFLGKPNPTYLAHNVKTADASVPPWMEKWVYQKLERRGWKSDVEELGELLRKRIERIEGRRGEPVDSTRS